MVHILPVDHSYFTYAVGDLGIPNPASQSEKYHTEYLGMPRIRPGADSKGAVVGLIAACDQEVLRTYQRIPSISERNESLLGNSAVFYCLFFSFTRTVPMASDNSGHSWADEITMDVGSGKGGLAQSRWHPNAGLGGLNNVEAHKALNTQPTKPNGSQERSDLKAEIDELRSMLEKRDGDDPLIKAARRVCDAAKSHPWRSTQSGDTHGGGKPVTERDVRKIILEATSGITKAVRSEIASAQPPKTWAKVAAVSPAPPTATTPATKVVPARHLWEITIRAENITEDLKKRSDKETVMAIKRQEVTIFIGIRSVNSMPSGYTTTSAARIARSR